MQPIERGAAKYKHGGQQTARLSKFEYFEIEKQRALRCFEETRINYGWLWGFQWVGRRYS